MSERSAHATVADPFEVRQDPAMSFMAGALDPREVEREFAPVLAGLRPGGEWKVTGIEVVRHKPGRRCLIEYRLVDTRTGERITLLGKVRARSLDLAAYETTRALWESGWNPANPDQIMVPEPLGVVPTFQMWLQHKVPGRTFTGLLLSPEAGRLAGRIADTALKLHTSTVQPRRRHTPADELDILAARLDAVADEQRELRPRLQRLLAACEEIASGLPELTAAAIHRDFYPDQVIIDGPRLYLVDLDLFTAGDPALDIGNFAGHLIEYSLRTLGHPDLLADLELALTRRYTARAGQDLHPRITAYTTLTLARHISISTHFPTRRHLTQPLLTLCEERLGIA